MAVFSARGVVRPGRRGGALSVNCVTSFDGMALTRRGGGLVCAPESGALPKRYAVALRISSDQQLRRHGGGDRPVRRKVG